MRVFSVFRAHGRFELNVYDFVVVSATTIIGRGYDGSLWLLRLCIEHNTMKRIELQLQTSIGAVYVMTAIQGAGVDVKQTVLQYATTNALRFARVNIDDARVNVEWTELVAPSNHCYRLSDDGRFVYGLSPWWDALRLRVFDVVNKSWTTAKLTGDLDGVSCPKYKTLSTLFSTIMAESFGRKSTLTFAA